MSGDGDDRLDALAEQLDELQDLVEDEENLEPVEPSEAVELWLSQLDRADSTLQSYGYRIQHFPEFCEENGIETLDELTTRDIKEYEASRRTRVGRQTANNQLGTLRRFLDYCEDMNAVSKDVIAALEVPSLTKENRVNTEKLVTERADRILDNLEKYRYASREHVLFLLLWRTTIRIGTLYSLDVEDVYLDEDDETRLRAYLREQGHQPKVVDEILEAVELPFLFPRHRPDTDSRLKNEEDGERVINIEEWVGEVVADYVEVNRPDVTDEYGRKPLLATRKGQRRMSKSAIRSTTYILTQPCEFGGPCPHDRDPEECEAREHGHGSKCPSSRSPHKLRTGSITWHRDRGWPMSELSDKANAGEDLIREVYDQPEKLVRGASRRQHLDKLDDSGTTDDS